MLTAAEWEVVLLSLRVAALAVVASLVPGIAVGWLSRAGVIRCASCSRAS